MTVLITSTIASAALTAALVNVLFPHGFHIGAPGDAMSHERSTLVRAARGAMTRAGTLPEP